jgi:hypothetical protein
MASTSDILTLVSSLALRLSVWIFLRWVSLLQSYIRAKLIMAFTDPDNCT